MLKGIGEGATYFYHPDHLGSVSVVSNHQGVPYERVEYLPFGEVWIEDVDPATSYIPFRFTSKELDRETGLYYYGARYYEPKVSRWMSADPAGFALINPMEPDEKGGWQAKASYSVIEAVNWYAYVSNNPVKYVDPTGMWIDNGDGTFTAEEGDTLYGLYGDNWREESGFGDRDPGSLQVGETVGKPTRGSYQYPSASLFGLPISDDEDTGAWVSSEFGSRMLNGVENRHYGIDIAAFAGTPIYAVGPGEVINVGIDGDPDNQKPFFGNYIEIKHDNGKSTVYAHMLQPPELGVGSMVRTGDKVGEVGSTGVSTGNHLHLGVYINGIPVNPRYHIRGDYTN